MKTPSQRYAALDVLRGMTVAGMILVNNPGSWSKIFPPLGHSAWHGCTPTDLVFPFFLFIVGSALSFSFAKYGDGLDAKSFGKLAKRAALMFLTGLLLNAYPFYPTSPDAALSFGDNYINFLGNIRIMGVLQRIGLCYLVGGTLALWLKKPSKIVVGMGVLMILHLAILVVFGGEDPFSFEGNIAGSIDVAIFGDSHVYHGFGGAFDPEGLLGVLSGSATLLLGYIIGGVIRNSENKSDAVAKLYTIGLVSIGVAMVMSIFIPINKPIWTPSYVLYAGGWSIVMLALFIYFIDIKGKEKIFFPFKAMGLNPLFAFVMAGVLAKTLGRVIKWTEVIVTDDWTIQEKTVSASSWIYNNFFVTIFGHNEFGSLMYALMYVTLFLLMAIWLYKKKIIIKL